LKPLNNDDVLDVLKGLSDLTNDTDPDELRRVAESAEGSVRRAAAMLSDNSLALRDVLTGMLERLPVTDPAEVLGLAEKVSGREGAPSFSLMIGLVQDWLHERLTLGAAKGDQRLAAWAALWEKTARTAREAEIYNLDRRPLVLAIFSDLAAAARG
jgi:DNA polymerase III subunit delta'